MVGSPSPVRSASFSSHGGLILVFLCCVAVSLQVCVDHYAADSRWYAGRCSSGAHLLLDDRAVHSLRSADGKVIEAGLIASPASLFAVQAVFLTSKGHVSTWCDGKASATLVGLVQNYERARQRGGRGILAPEGVVP